jgi:hypothetical protein
MGRLALSALGPFLILLSACASNPSSITTLEPVPADRVPEGYLPSDCHYEAAQDSGGVSNTSAGIEAGAHTSKQIMCHRATVKHSTESKCVGDDGKEKPMSQCKPE